MVAGQNYRRPLQVKSIQKGSNEERERAEYAAGGLVVLSVTYLIRDEVFIECEFVGRGNVCQHLTGIFGSARSDGLAAIDQHRISEILIDGTSSSQVSYCIEA